jgi:hypothetical protein
LKEEKEMGVGALFVDLVKKILRRRRLVPSEVRALKWGVLRVLGLVDSPVKVHHRDPSFMEEVVLDEALRLTRRSLEVSPEEEMSPARRYNRVEIPYSAAGVARGDSGGIRILSPEEAKRLEVKCRKLHTGAPRLEDVEEMGEPFEEVKLKGWNK